MIVFKELYFLLRVPNLSQLCLLFSDLNCSLKFSFLSNTTQSNFTVLLLWTFPLQEKVILMFTTGLVLFEELNSFDYRCFYSPFLKPDAELIDVLFVGCQNASQ